MRLVLAGVRLLVMIIGSVVAWRETKDSGRVEIIKNPNQPINQSSNSLININTATASELETLWGIGEKRAAAIIDNRPYGSIDELADKAGIPESVLKKIRSSLVL